MKTAALIALLAAPIAFAADEAAHKRAIESNLATAVAIEGTRGPALAQRMRELGVPALSYAVVEDGKIVLAAAYGEADVARHRAATTSTLFQAASISKPVSAMGAMELVERGKLPLDVPVNTLLRSWQLPENELTAKTPVTLRMLFSHSGGTTVHGFPGYARDAKLPSVPQVLDGKPPANTAPVIVDLAPNTKYVYSGGGITIAQQALIDQTGLPFPTFMQRTVLGPLGMTASTYEQPLPAARRTAAATAYNVGMREVDGKWHVYPEMAAAGLWTTPSDLARVILEMQNALAGRRTKLLSIDAARLMLTPRFAAGATNSIGFGFFIEKHGGVPYLNHGGANEGFRSLLVGSMDGSKGAVVMVNADGGTGVMQDVVNTIAREYRWPGYASAAPMPRGTLSPEDAARYAGHFELESHDILSIRQAAGGLEIADLASGWQPLIPLTDGTLGRADRDVRYQLAGDALTVIAGANRNVARRLPADTPPTAHELLAGGEIEKAMAAYREQFRTNPKSLPEERLNNTGYGLAIGGRIAQGLALLRLNTEFYPASANTWDSLADALMFDGRKAEAIQATEEELRRIEADPVASPELKNELRDVGQRRLKKLRP